MMMMMFVHDESIKVWYRLGVHYECKLSFTERYVLVNGSLATPPFSSRCIYHKHCNLNK
jgi:hypothetical protein